MLKLKHYVINEIFYSLQGEGIRAGTANVFIRFTGCNLQCDLEKSHNSPGGFKCDTEFVSGRKLTLDEILKYIEKIANGCNSLILTGGEPGLQVDEEFCDFFRNKKYYLAIETNGSIQIKGVVDWITVSPKVAEHAIVQQKANEVKYVRGYGQGIPKPTCKATYKLLSPAFDGNVLDLESLRWCIKLVKEHPEWRLSIQQHKIWNVR